MQHCPNCGTKFSHHEAFCPYDGTPTVTDAPGTATDPWLGVVIDSRYRMEARIGEGGMGIVYKATHVLLNKRLAIKVVRADHSKDGDVAERFMQEARAATSIGHPNIIDINDFGRMPDGSLYFAMELLDGRGLEDAMEHEPLPIDVAVHVTEQIASALGAAHERGIVHRDLKPDNVFLIKHRDDPHFVKVLDFGIAKVAGGSTRATRAGVVIGTPHYMSPEQAAGQSVDHRADIYALGVMMYEMFTGQLPFDAETFMGVLTMHMYDPPPLPSQISDEVAERVGELEGVVLRALSKKPELRYQSMAELRADLLAVHGGRAMAAKKDVALDRTLAAVGVALPPPSPAVSDAQRAARTVPEMSPAAANEARLAEASRETIPMALPRSSLPRQVGVIASIAVLVLAMWWLWPSRESDGPQPPVAAAADKAASNPVATPIAAPPSPTPTAPSEPAVPEPVAAPVERTVEVVSDPPGAQVFHDGALLGAAPLRLPRPSLGHLDVELQLDGRRTTLLRITHTSPERIVATLAPGSTVTGAKRAPVAKTNKVAPAPAPTAPPPRRTGIGGMRDVVDPWNE